MGVKLTGCLLSEPSPGTSFQQSAKGPKIVPRPRGRGCGLLVS